MFNFITYEWVIFLGKVLGALLTIGGFVAAVFRYWIIPAYTRASNNIKYIFRIAANADNIHNIIQKELTHNGGASLKDAVRRIETSIHVNNNKFRSYLSLQKQPIWESDADGNCEWVNDAYTRITGYSLDHLKNRGWMMIVKRDERAYIENEWQRSIAERRTFNHQLTIVGSNGDEYKVHAHGYPVVSNTGDVMGYIGILDAVEVQCTCDGCTNTISAR